MAKTECRRCTDCEGLDHHWMADCDEETGLPVMVCKHCEATREMTDADFDEPDDDDDDLDDEDLDDLEDE
jgi:hypothetical protein